MSDITKDPAINLNRTAREVFDTYFNDAQKHIMAMRKTILDQAERIEALEITEDELCIETNQQSVRVHDLEQDNGILIAVNAQWQARYDRLGEVVDELKIDIKELEYNNSTLHEVLSTKHDDCVPNTLGDASIGKSRMAEAFADMVIEKRYPMHIANRLPPPDLIERQVQILTDHRARLNRIADGIKNRINDGHTAMALMLCDALKE